MWKAGALALKIASEEGLVIVTADTSPRLVGPPSQQWDLGPGASFYVDATTEDYGSYQMYTYIVHELFDLIVNNFPVDCNRVSLSGHSMGGHGALVLGTRNPNRFKSLSAFAPICNPSAIAVGINAFTHYLGNDKNDWKCYDFTEIIKSGLKYDRKILIDCGTNDQFLQEFIVPENLIKVAEKHGIDLEFNWREGYDHSYYFVSSFIENHLRFHIKFLKE